MTTFGLQLLRRKPPNGDAPYTPEECLWWGVIHQAAVDVLRGDEPDAWDGAEFLRGTGTWLCETMFGIPPDVTKKELVQLLRLSPALADRVAEALGGPTSSKD